MRHVIKKQKTMDSKNQMQKREIKFRGKRVDNGEWIVGNIHIPDMLFTGVFICPTTSYGDIAPGLEDGEDLAKVKKHGAAIGHYHRIIPESAGQFTGLHDKTGKEIYEGDIINPVVMNGTITRGEVVFHYGGFMAKQIGAEWLIDDLYRYDNFEVIGNIYENPELLK